MGTDAHSQSGTLAGSTAGIIRSFLELHGLLASAEEIAEIEKITDLGELEEQYWQCSYKLQPLIETGYQALLQRVTDLRELEQRYGNCPFQLQSYIEARYRELLPTYLQKVSNIKSLETRHRRCSTGLRHVFINVCLEPFKTPQQ